MTVLIRPLRSAEAAAAEDLLLRVAYEFFADGEAWEAFAAQWREWGAFADVLTAPESYTAAGGEFLAVEVDGQLVGTGAYRRYEDLPGYCEIKRIALLPGQRGERRGYALLQTLLDRARAAGYTHAILWTNREKLARAVALYFKLGFVETKPPGAEDWQFWMEMPLTPP